MPTVNLGYVPRKDQHTIHKALALVRFAVLVCHRRFGKTVLAVMTLIDAALRCRKQDGRYGYVAPYYRQAKQVAWAYFKLFASPVPGVKFNEAELTVTFPNGAVVALFGSDNPDSMRGIYFDGVVLDEVATMRPEVWGEIIRPALADRRGFALFIGTPKGQNLFHELYENALQDPKWYAGMFRADETDVISEEELALARETMTDNQYRQEFLCDFTASSDDILITIDLISAACKRKVVHEASLFGLPKVMGVDVARYGGDSTVIARRHGHVLYEPQELRNLNNMHVAGVVAQQWQSWQPDAVFIDGGRGEGVIDRVRQLGYEPVEVIANSTEQVLDPHYANKKTEIWALGKRWIEECGSLPNHTRLKTELCAPTYSFDGPRGTMLLEKSKKTKEKLRHSPDFASAFMLTFAFPVEAAQKVDPLHELLNQPRIVTEYDPYPVEAA